MIQRIVAQAWGVTVDGLRSASRTKHLTVPRQVAMFLIRDLLGTQLVEIGNPSNAKTVLEKSTGVFDTINESEAHQIHDALMPHSHLYTPQVRERVRKGERISPERYAEALRRRDQWTRDWREIMTTHHLDAIAHPTIDAAPPLIDDTRPPKGPSIRLSVPWSIADFPALSVPAGFDTRGLPVGLSLAAIPEREADLLALGIRIDEDLRLWRHGPPTGP